MMKVAVALVAVTLSFGVYAADRDGARTGPHERIGLRPKFVLTSPRGDTMLAADECEWSGDSHEPPACTVTLVGADGRRSSWEIANVEYGAWSGDGSTFVVETRAHALLVGTATTSPQEVEGTYTRPALSPSGHFLAAVALGPGADRFEQLDASPGITMRDLTTGKSVVAIAGPDVYSPFFIDEDRLGYGSGGADHVASLFFLDIASSRTVRLTNLDAATKDPDAFPETAPVLNDSGDELRFVATDDERRTFALSLTTHRLRSIGTSENEIHAWPTLSNKVSGGDADVLDSVPMLNSAVMPSAASKVYFRLPLKSYQGVYQFYDHAGKDWACGKKTYSGHRGTDFKANLGDPIVAAAAGSLYYRYDNCPNTGFFGDTCGGGLGNHVRIQHADTRVTVYAHMKKGTPGWPSTVLCGATVGNVGVSGSTNIPHVHFDVWNNTGGSIRIDPYSGSCDAGASDWNEQIGKYPDGYVSLSCTPICTNTCSAH